MPRSKPEPSVLLVGVDDPTAHVCAEAASPVKIVRAERLDIAVDRARRLKPLAVILGSDAKLRPAEVAALLAHVLNKRSA